MSKDKENKNKPKSLFDVAREIDAKEQQELNDAQVAAETAEKLAQEKENRNTKIELIRVKQGSSDGSAFKTDGDVAVRMPPLKRIQNFFYHHWWWLCIAAVLTAIAVVLVINYVGREKYDNTVIFLHGDREIGESKGLSDYIASFCDDVNGDGKVLAGVYVYSNGNGQDMGGGVIALRTQLESAYSMIVIASDSTDEMIAPEYNLVNLEKVFGENKFINRYRFYLKNTDFAERIGFTGNIPDDMYIGIRKINKVKYATVEEMREAYERDFAVFERIIEDLSN